MTALRWARRQLADLAATVACGLLGLAIGVAAGVVLVIALGR